MGYTIPNIPVVFIEARNRDEAKELLLKCISQFGTVTQEGFAEFADFSFDFADFEIPGISFDSLTMGGEDDGQPPLEESDFSYKEQFGVIVICENETEQEAVYTKLAAEGYNVRVVKT
jgi:predicted 3-demethylubiquinone-9 3-methyltransferase (glyoxalase superfamily)